LFYISLALGVLAKGVIFLPVAPAILINQLVLRRKSHGGLKTHLIGAILFCAIALPWFVYVARTVPHAIDLWRYESVGEFGDNAEKARPWWLYAMTSFQLPLPWTPMWIAGLCLLLARKKNNWRSPRAKRRWFAVGWFVITLAIFSMAHVKKNAYL